MRNILSGSSFRDYFRHAVASAIFAVLPLAAHAENLAVNGGFDANLDSWTAFAISGPLAVSTTSASTCFEHTGNTAAAFNVFGGRKSALEQSITLPAAGTFTLKFRAWGQLDPTTLAVKIKDANSVEHTLDSFVAVRLIQGYTLPGPVFTCTGNTPELKSYDISQFAGQSVTLHFDATSTGSDGTFAIIDDIEVTPGDGSSDLRGTAVKLFCNRSGDLTTATCVATVGDTGAPPRTNPTGEVQFAATEGTLAGTSCALQGVSLSPGVASCSMTYYPPAGFPIGSAFPVSATYVGDTNFDASTTSHELILASCVGTDAKPCPSSVGLGFDELPAILDKLVSMSATCGGGAQTQAARASGSDEIRAREIPPYVQGGACEIVAGLGIDVKKLLEEIPQEDLLALYIAYKQSTGGGRDAIFTYAENASALEQGFYSVIQENEAAINEIFKAIEKNSVQKDWNKLFSKYRIGHLVGRASGGENKKKKQSLVQFATVTRTIGADKTVDIKFKLNKRAQNIVSFLKTAGIAALPLKATMTVRQKKRFGKATLSQSVDVVLR